MSGVRTNATMSRFRQPRLTPSGSGALTILPARSSTTVSPATFRTDPFTALARHSGTATRSPFNSFNTNALVERTRTDAPGGGDRSLGTGRCTTHACDHPVITRATIERPVRFDRAIGISVAQAV